MLILRDSSIPVCFLIDSRTSSIEVISPDPAWTLVPGTTLFSVKRWDSLSSRESVSESGSPDLILPVSSPPATSPVLLKTKQPVSCLAKTSRRRHDQNLACGLFAQEKFCTVLFI